MAYQCVARNIDEFLHQVTRLIGTGHYFYFSCLLGPEDDPEKLDRKIVNHWNLDIPYWKRAARCRGRAPNIHYLRYGSFYALLATHGRSTDGSEHPFFVEYEKTLLDIRKYSLKCFGYSIRYTASMPSNKRKVLVRLDKDAKHYLRTDLIRKSTRGRYASRESLEYEIKNLPYQWYKPVRDQVKQIIKEVNSIRRRAGIEQVRLGCVPDRMRPPKKFSSGVGVNGKEIPASSTRKTAQAHVATQAA